MSLPRFELKYWADEQQLKSLFNDLAGLLGRDPHASDAEPSYTITSLYLDTGSFKHFVEKVEGLRVRNKVRLRRYNAELDGFIEVKAKRGRRILKHRVVLDADQLRQVACGQFDTLEAQVRRGSEAAGRVLNQLSSRPLGPCVITRYQREAHFFRDDPGVRITVDRSLVAWGEDLLSTFLDPQAPPMLTMLPSESRAILEVKCSGPVPSLVAAALRRANLVRQSISKYCLSVLRARDLPPSYQGFHRILLPRELLRH